MISVINCLGCGCSTAQRVLHGNRRIGEPGRIEFRLLKNRSAAVGHAAWVVECHDADEPASAQLKQGEHVGSGAVALDGQVGQLAVACELEIPVELIRPDPRRFGRFGGLPEHRAGCGDTLLERRLPASSRLGQCGSPLTS